MKTSIANRKKAFRANTCHKEVDFYTENIAPESRRGVRCYVLNGLLPISEARVRERTRFQKKPRVSDDLGGPWGSLGGSLGVPMGSGTGPAPGTGEGPQSIVFLWK